MDSALQVKSFDNAIPITPGSLSNCHALLRLILHNTSFHFVFHYSIWFSFLVGSIINGNLTGSNLAMKLPMVSFVGKLSLASAEDSNCYSNSNSNHNHNAGYLRITFYPSCTQLLVKHLPTLQQKKSRIHLAKQLQYICTSAKNTEKPRLQELGHASIRANQSCACCLQECEVLRRCMFDAGSA